MEFPYITATLAGVLVILQQALMLNVGMHRVQTRIGVGVAEDLHLERKVRRHGNLAENAALLLVVLALAELSGAPKSVIAAFAGVFAVARISHALGFSHLDGSHNADGNKLYTALRAVGAFGSVMGGIGLGGYLLYRLLGA